MGGQTGPWSRVAASKSTIKAPFARHNQGPYVQVMTSCVAVCPPVPAVKPTKAVFPPTVPGISMVQEFVKVALVTVSVMVIVRVVPL